ncbi:DUF2459 domain-containing protein [Pararhizobium sp.]|uniref:DUF2459 domain-containing protein n=1 Tax=Pararhizobium sp. TaxID=1977563 RepID=UPI002721E8B2|nr:DUF2459 domain-containing protein [Pararhizobium sp.]MDO9417304.1 DUF2459 domain-containing protein [Pararhizobium sp.]
MKSFLITALKIVGGVPAAALLVVAIVGLATMRFADPALYPPAASERHYGVGLADHGIHTGLILNRADLAEMALTMNDPVLIALSERFAFYGYLEIGWGDETFYRFAPAWSDITLKMGSRALFGFNGATVLHIAGFEQGATQSFPASDVVELSLSERGLRRLAEKLSASFARTQAGQPVELGQGIYGPSLFYQATGHYSLLNTCNRWISDLLSAAGLATSPVPAAFSPGLLAEIRARN